MDVYRPHALVLPFPAQGHITPMLSFSHLLAARGVVVTFLNTDKVHARLLACSSGEEREADGAAQKKKEEESSLDMRFEVMPDGSPEPLPGTQPSSQPSDPLSIFKGMESHQMLYLSLRVEAWYYGALAFRSPVEATHEACRSSCLRIDNFCNRERPWADPSKRCDIIKWKTKLVLTCQQPGIIIHGNPMKGCQLSCDQEC